VLTPDSSRYWEASSLVPGTEPDSFDKQIVRNWLETLEWDKTPPGPAIPVDIVERTLDRYYEVYKRLTAVTKGHNS
jgi:phosphoribosylaminoimidazole-succinocarboxamide synthase